MSFEVHISLVIEEEEFSESLFELFKSFSLSSYWKKNDYQNKTLLKHKNNGCEYKNKTHSNIDLEELVDKFLNHIETEKREFCNGIKKNKLTPTFCIAIYYDDRAPSIHLNKLILQKLVKLNAEIDIDLISCELN